MSTGSNHTSKDENRDLTHYEILGVNAFATYEEIKKEFRKRVLVCHPDKVSGKQAEFRRLQEAWKTLSADNTREKYDRKLKDMQIVKNTSDSNHQEIDLDDMEYNEEDRCFTYPCRCGNYFVVTEDELEIGDADIECTGCSLRATVLYEIHSEISDDDPS